MLNIDLWKVKTFFDAQVVKQDGCWGWNCSTYNRYPRIYVKNGNSRYIRAHRASWMIYQGDIPVGLYVLHTCDNTVCTNPDHLFIGTHKDNMSDMAKKGRVKHGKRIKKEK